MEFNDLRAAAQDLVDQASSARSRAEQDSRRGLFILLRGFQVEGDPDQLLFDIDGRSALISLHRVRELPSLPNLYAAVARDSLGEALLIGPLLRQPAYEFYLSDEWSGGNTDHGAAMRIAETCVHAVRMKAGSGLTALAVSNHSWLHVAAGQEVRMNLLGREWSAEAGASCPVEIKTSDIEWAIGSLERILALYVAEPRFAFAFDVSSMCLIAADMRAAMSMVWAGIESLLGTKQELTFRISHYISHFEDTAASRRAVRQATKRLYGSRSKVVHGEKISQDQLRTDLLASQRLLSSALVKCIEARRVPSQDEFEDALSGFPLFGGASGTDSNKQDPG